MNKAIDKEENNETEIKYTIGKKLTLLIHINNSYIHINNKSQNRPSECNGAEFGQKPHARLQPGQTTQEKMRKNTDWWYKERGKQIQEIK